MKSNVTLRMTSTTLLRAMPNDSQYAAIVTIKDANNVHLIVAAPSKATVPPIPENTANGGTV